MSIFPEILLYASVGFSLPHLVIFVPKPPSHTRALMKTAGVFLLALAAYFYNAPYLLVFGLLLSAAGDAFLAYEGEKNFLLGLSSFLVAHILYVALFIQTGAGFAALSENPVNMGIAGILLSVGAFMLWRLWNPVKALRIPVIFYMLAILSMGVCALTLPFEMPFLLAIIGAALFIISDMLLSIEMFILSPSDSRRVPTSYSVWIFYWSGQALILLAFIQM